MATGLSTDQWIPLIDARQFLACVSTRSARPNWLDEEELALSGLQEKCQLEMKAAAEAQRKASGKVGDPLEYPFPPSDIGGNPTLTVMTLDANRACWTSSCGELYAQATAAMNVSREKLQKLRSADAWIAANWRAGRSQIKGRKVGGSTGEHDVVDPTINRLGPIESRDVGDKVNGMRTDIVVVEEHDGYYTERRLYEDILMEQAELIKLAQSAGADAVNDSPVAEPAGTQLPSLSPDGMPGLADSKVNPAQAKKAGAGSVPPAWPAPAQEIVLQAIAALGLQQIAPRLPDKELQRRIEPWCSAQGKETPSTKTIRRTFGKN
jgi:hypothetical protein